MAIHTLPNGSIWDSNISEPSHQTSGSQNWWSDMIESITPETVSESTINSSRNRIVKQTWTDTSYSGSNYIAIRNVSYMNSAMSDACFAIRRTSWEYKVESK